MHNFAKMQKQARQLQEQLEKMQNELKSKDFTATSGAGLVTVILTGGKIKEITIKPECVDPSDVEGLQDLIKAACNDAFSQFEQAEAALMPQGFPF
jgi:nucleoid-associated protein EbfC